MDQFGEHSFGQNKKKMKHFEDHRTKVEPF